MALGPTTRLLVLGGLLAWPGAAHAGGGFTIAGRPVAPQEANFAGNRHASPAFHVMVQINHDTRADAALDLALVDEAFHAVRGQQRRDPYFPLERLPLVFIADAKIRRFIEGPSRLLFGRLDTQIKQQQEVYPTPNAIFVTDAALGEVSRLRQALRRALGFFFDLDFYRAVVGLDHALPRPAD